MHQHVRDRILRLTKADDIDRTELIQPLWNNYGTLSRVFLHGGDHPSVIVKHITIPDQLVHPRGFATSISRDRKVRSYQVETHWYQHQNQQVSAASPTPTCLDAFEEGGELFLLLEDLSTRGFHRALYRTSWSEISVVLRWLAHFHAQFLGDSAQGLWPCGTYWHLETRPDELATIEGTRLHRFASLLDARLRCGAFPTLVHGDAKLANFLFTNDHARVAAVDFQYVGHGAAMKDVAYFVGSCLSGPECERLEEELLDLYFSSLGDILPDNVDAMALETEWRLLYPVAWADFQRFMSGWSPGHRKLT
ncbi:MAG: phosphotransferase, partial [Myxococcota bacterium]